VAIFAMSKRPAILERASRHGAHVLLPHSPRDPWQRVVRRHPPPAFAMRTLDDARRASFREHFDYAAVDGAAELPGYVDAVASDHGWPSLTSEVTAWTLVFTCAEGVTLHEIITRTDLEGARVDPAVLAHVVARSFRAAASPPLAGSAAGVADDVAAVDAQVIRVGFDGSVTFVGRVPRRVPVVPLHLAPPVDVPRPWIAARSIVQRALADVPRRSAVLDWMDSVARTVRPLDAGLWNEVAERLVDVVDTSGVDTALLGGIARSLFPEDYAVAVDVAEQTALLHDDDLAAVT
jgi:hypothetical protein